MRKIFGVSVLFFCGLALAGPGDAQTAPAQAPPAQAAAAPQDSGITIRTTVSEVALDMVVRDKKGKVVKTLKPSDVEIYADGVRQDLRSFRLVTGATAQQMTAPTAPGEPAPAGKTKPVLLPLKETNVVCIVFQNLDPYTKKWAVDAVQEFLRGDVPKDAMIGIFNLGSRLGVVQTFTTDRQVLIEAAKNAFTHPTLDFVSASTLLVSMNPMVVTADLNGLHISGGEINSQATGDVGVETTLSAQAQRADLASQNRQFQHIEAARQTDQIVTMIRDLQTLPGRKTVLLLTPGLTGTGDPDRFQKIVSTAAHANITFYGIDVHGLSENSNAQAGSAAMQHIRQLSQGQAGSPGSYNAPAPGGPGGSTTVTPTGSAGASMAQMRQDDEVIAAVRGSDPQASLRALSEGTGGFMIANTNDLRKPFQRVVDDMDTHYEAVFRSTSATLDGRLHKLEVKLARPDLTADTRAGYFAMPDLKGSPVRPFEVAALMALSEKPQPHAFDFKAGAFQFRPEAENSQYGVAFEVPISSLTATPLPQLKKHRLHLSLFALVKDASGEVIDKFSQDSPYDVPDENLKEIQATPVTYSHELSLPPGHYTVETVVVDREARKSSTGVVQLDSSERKGLSLSSIMLVKQLESVVGQGDPHDPFQFQGRRVVPEMASTLASGAQPYLYFVVYPDRTNSEKPSVEIQVSLDGEEIAQQEAELGAPDATGAIPVVIGGAPVKPGAYELTVTATQGGQSVDQTVKYTVAAQPESAAAKEGAAQ